MATVKIIELIGTSTKDFEDALQSAVTRAHKTTRGITGVDVVSQKAVVVDGKVTEYRVNCKVAFALEE